MNEFLNFKIQPHGEISQEFLKRNVYSFKEAADLIANLRYGRNGNKNALKTVFTDSCGTCSTKHALLKRLADENGFAAVKLILGIFKMSSKNTIEIAQTLRKNNLEFIPEAHNYLKFENRIFDFTKPGAHASDFENDLIVEIELMPDQISEFKVEFHKKVLQDWLNRNPNLAFNLEQIWQIREQCIRDLFN